MPTVQVNHVVKSYADKVAVDDLSFSVAPGEIFGLIGPNGAGKTTTIRMMMDIIKPDSGEITVFGQQLSEASKDRLGYLPEETGMLPNRKKKIDELSKGMGQIIQFIITIIHDPELIILDEAFSGLDPVNTELLKGLVVDLRNQGKTVALSTHQMNQVEELCDRILMMDHGRAVLCGDLAEIKAKYRSNSVIVEAEGELGQIPGVREKRPHKDYVELALDSNTTPRQVLERLMSTGLAINRFEIATPSLNEIFLGVVGENHE
jgi:ABC-2 type transport system ATP-binding protein